MKSKRGFTTVELLVSFIIVSTLVTSMLLSIIGIRERQTEESAYSTVVTAKNSITKLIQSELVEDSIVNLTNPVVNDAECFLSLGGVKNAKYDFTITSSCITYGKDLTSETVCLPKITDPEGNLLLKFDYKNTTVVNTKTDNTKSNYISINIPIIHSSLEEQIDIEIISAQYK